MDKHAVPNRPSTAPADTTGLRLAPPGLLQVARWQHLTENPVMVNEEPSVINANPVPSHAYEDG